MAWVVLCLGAFVVSVSSASASDLDEFRVKREAVFEFAQKPVVTRQGDRVTIEFETKGFCDVTVAIENDEGRILRHLASGVLGPNAPEPFQKNTKKQALLWDGKDDQGAYIDEKDALTVRVSLGLKPRFERTLFWHPMKPNWHQSPIACPAPEGVYVYQGGACDQLRLLDHDGNYVRAVYPFPASTVDQVKGLRRHTFPQDGRMLPLKGGYLQATLLTSGPNSEGYTEEGAARAVAVHGNAIALVHQRTNWLTTAGSAPASGLAGPETGFDVTVPAHSGGPKQVVAVPRSAVFSADGQWVYLTGYVYQDCHLVPAKDWLHVVVRMRANGRSAPEVFAGSPKQYDCGKGDTQFNAPTSVDCDAAGRIYVSDYVNNRVQVFSEDRRLLKSIPVRQPAQVAVHRKTGHIYVFTWRFHTLRPDENPVMDGATVTHLGPFEKPEPIATYPLPLEGRQDTDQWDRDGGRRHRVALDSWSEHPRIWVVHRPAQLSERDSWAEWDRTGLLLLEEKDGRLTMKRDFRQDVRKAVVRTKPPILWRQRLYVDPTSGALYVGEGDAGVMKSFRQLVAIDPDSGRARLVDLPFDAEDMCIDLNGLVYLRTDEIVARYDPRTWREVPFDYGVERESVSFGGWDGRAAPVTAGIPLPGRRPGCFHEGGMWISANGHLAVTCFNSDEKVVKMVGFRVVFESSGGRTKYTPRLYPGRCRGFDIHVWDRHGKLVYEDAVPGLTEAHGIGIDREDAIYILAGPTRVLDGERYFDKQSCTLVKFRPKQGKFLSPSGNVPIPLPPEGRPQRPGDLESGGFGAGWAEGAEWFYGGVGFTGSGGCSCWNCRPAFDYFARSFVPETRRFSVAVLDAGGNLILRVGQYGNVDDGDPLAAGVRGQGSGVRDPESASLTLTPDTRHLTPGTRSIGGDEVALFHAAYLGTHTDRRLFIADAGNARILSVKLDYHATGKVALKDVPDRSAAGN